MNLAFGLYHVLVFVLVALKMTTALKISFSWFAFFIQTKTDVYDTSFSDTKTVFIVASTIDNTQ